MHQPTALPAITTDPAQLSLGIGLMLVVVILAVLVWSIYRLWRVIDKHELALEEISDFMQAVSIATPATRPAPKIRAILGTEKEENSGVVRMESQPKHHRRRPI